MTEISQTRPLKPDSSPVDFLSVPLTPAQQRVVACERTDHLHVVAPPGSGKTLTITRRIAHLLGPVHKVDPESVMALTFTERAANELVTRLATMVRPGVYAGTFHSACLRILREHATVAIGARAPIVFSEQDRQLLMKDAAILTGRKLNDFWVGELLRSLSRMKCTGLTAEEAFADFKEGPEAAQEIVEIYQKALKEEGGCDFDDLIIQTADLLENDQEAAQRVHNRFQYIFIDEYQDVSAEQYRLIRALIPPEDGTRQLLVVTDANQAIFGFRGAFPERMLSLLRSDYRPARFELNENHRSVAPIVQMAQKLMHRAGAEEVSRITRSQGDAVDWFECEDEFAEATLVADLVDRAVTKGRRLSEIAILYRRHKRANTVEVALANRSIPVRRLQPDRFFDDRDVQETIRYFELVAATRDKSFAAAINWPRFLVDELTMVDLRRIAARHNLTLGELAESAELLRAEASPLTATQISRFMSDVILPARSTASEGAVACVDQMLAMLRSRRDPVPSAERGNFRATLDELGRFLGDKAASLETALTTGRSIVVEHDADPDCLMASMLLTRALDDYFPLAREGSPFLVALGETARHADLRLNWDAESAWTVTAQAWRLIQMVLMRQERLHLGEFTLFDTETTSSVPLTAEIMEIAAVRVRDRSVLNETFCARIRPSSPDAITAGAQNVHGISWQMVANERTADEVIPEFLEFVGDRIVAGHNIVSFDSRILDRECQRLELDSPTVFQIDTLQLARRLRPRQRNALDDLLTEEERRQRGKHSALFDAQLNAKVLLRLLHDLRRDREIGVLSEALPMVAASIVVRQADSTPDNALLIRIGARALHVRPDWYLPVTDVDGAISQWLCSAAEQLERVFTPESDDQSWQALEDDWRAFVDGFSRFRPNLSLAELLERVSLATVSDLDRGERERVTMMTIYSAKGHEWPIVFMIGAEDGEYPYSHSRDLEEEVQESRRVFYVGMTRAQDRLLLTSARRFEHQPRSPSPFLRDIDDLVRHHVPKNTGADH